MKNIGKAAIETLFYFCFYFAFNYVYYRIFGHEKLLETAEYGQFIVYWLMLMFMHDKIDRGGGRPA